MHRTAAVRTERGYTLIEIMLAVMLIGIVGGMAVMQVGAVRPRMIADGAMRTVIGQLNYARELAVSQRRYVQVEFDTDTNRVTVTRIDYPGPATTLMSTVTLEGGAHYELLDDVPDTPDKFGKGSAADFDSALTVWFNTEGMLVDGDGGNIVNGTVFLNTPGGGGYRAVTVLGAIGRVRGYRWNGTDWTRS